MRAFSAYSAYKIRVTSPSTSNKPIDFKERERERGWGGRGEWRERERSGERAGGEREGGG